MKQEATKERDMFMRVLEEQKELEIKERQVQHAKRYASVEHSYGLKDQITNKNTLKALERQSQLEEGKKIRRQQAEEIMKLE
jgi:hypothetical protein